jgi:hypothetical protein
MVQLDIHGVNANLAHIKYFFQGIHDEDLML